MACGAFKIDRVFTYDETLVIHKSGDVAWFSTRLDGDATPIEKGEQISVRGIRITGVLEKRDSGWRVVQYHSSRPVAGQNIEY